MKRFLLVINIIACLFSLLPQAKAQINQTVVNGAATTAVNFPGTGCVYNWVNDTPGIGLAASGTGNIASFNAVNTGSSLVTATITATPTPPSSMFAYIANSSSNTVSVINLATNTVTKTIAVGNNPIGVSVSPDGNHAYVTNQGMGSISVINTVTNSVISTITTVVGAGAEPTGVVVSPDGGTVYVTDYRDNTLLVINTLTNAIISTIPVGRNPFGITISQDGSLVYITNLTDSTVSVVNTATNTVIYTMSVGTNPGVICLSPDGSMLYVANQSSNSVLVVNTSTHATISTIAVGLSPSCVALSLDGGRLYVTNTNDNTVSVINAITYAILFTINVASMPDGESLSPDGSKLYVTNSGANSVSVINTSTNVVIATIPVGLSPFSIGNFIANGKSCNGTPVTFTITVNPTPPSTITSNTVTGNISACAGMASASPNIQQFTVSGSNLTADITAGAPTGFEVSLSPAGNYASSITITQSGGTVNSTVVYVRSAASALAGNISGDVTLISTGTTSQNVTVNGIINATTIPSISITASTNNICAGTPITFTATSTNGGNSPGYEWLVNGRNTGTTGPTFTSSILANGDAVTCLLASTAVCSIPPDVTSNSITMNVYPEPIVNAGGNKTIKEGNSIILNATASVNIANITWSPFTGLNNNRILNPKANPTSTTTYTLTVQTVDGCIGIDTATLTVFIDISVPNTFTPNGDGINDTWDIKYLDSYPNCTVKIYNRYGENVYSSIGYGIPWNGTYNGSALPTGPYYYIINLKNGIKVLSGDVTIIR